MRPMNPRVRVAVIGVGALGRHHARILSALPDVDLVGVVDINQPRAQEIAASVRAPWSVDASTLLGKVDAVTIAVPTASHLGVALPFLERGTAVLVEKPLAATLEDGRRMIEAADASGAVFGVGHTGGTARRLSPCALD